MTFLVKFSEQGGSFQAEFGETHNISDGGYERGYAKGYEEGRDGIMSALLQVLFKRIHFQQELILYLIFQT